MVPNVNTQITLSFIQKNILHIIYIYNGNRLTAGEKIKPESYQFHVDIGMASIMNFSNRLLLELGLLKLYMR